MGGEQKASVYTQVTTLAANDLVWIMRISDSADPDKRIIVDDYFGKTSGIPFDVGVGGAPLYRVHAHRSGASCVVAATRTDTPMTAYLTATSTGGAVGTLTSQIRIAPGAITKLTIEATTGVITAPGVYTTDVAGLTKRAVWVSDTGILGYDSSSERYKTNIVDATGAEWIYSLTPREYERIDNPGVVEVGLIAEEVDVVPGIPAGIVTYETYIIEGATLKPITDEFVNPTELKNVTEKNIIIPKQATKILSRVQTEKEAQELNAEIGDPKETENIEIEVKRVPETVELTRLIVPLLTELKILRGELDDALARIKVLEGK